MSEQAISWVKVPTASFSLTVAQIQWIADEAERRGIKKSALVREILDEARQRAEQEEAA